MTGWVIPGDYHGKMREYALLSEGPDSLSQPLLETECKCPPVHYDCTHVSLSERLAL
jgi:hypothetical protein